jgi:hypothetical protein
MGTEAKMTAVQTNRTRRHRVASSNDRKRTQWSFGLLILAHLIAACFHGAELVWEVAVIAVMLGVASTLFLLTQHTLYITAAKSKVALLLLGAWLVYLCLSIIPLPLEWVRWLNPAAANWYINALPNSNLAYLSVAPHTSMLEVFEYVTLFTFFMLTYACLSHTKRALALTYWLIGIGTLVAVYSIINHLTDGRFEVVEAIPPWDSEWKKAIRGTFSYKNQYAVYVAMLIPLTVGVFKDQIYAKRLAYKPTTIWQNGLLIITSRLSMLMISTVLLLYVLSQTDSRGAVVALIVSSGLVVAKHWILQRGKAKAKPKAAKVTALRIGGYFLAMAILAIIFVNSASFDRFKNYGIQDNGRAQLHQVAKKVINDFPILGSGAGTYPLIQHAYKPASLGNNAMSKRAHSDYLEILASQGIIGFSLLFGALILLLVPIFKGRSTRHPNLLLGCQCSLCVLILHSSFDFNLATFYLPALFLTIMCIAYRLIDDKTQLRANSG